MDHQMLLLAAGEGSPTTMNWLPALTSLVVFILFFLALRVKVWPQISSGLEDRERKIREEIESAEQAREKANAALAEYESSLAEARKEANETIARAREDAKAAADELKKRNEAELTEMKERAKQDIETARRAAITELHSETANLAAEIARRILQREISAEDQQRLVDESLQELAKSDV